MNDLPRAKEWLGSLKEGFPKSFEEKKGPEIEKLIARQAYERRGNDEKEPRLEELFVAASSPARSRGAASNELAVASALRRWRASHAILMDRGVDNRRLLRTGIARLKSLVPGGLYQFEMWWQDIDRIPPPAAHQVPSLGFNLLKDGEAGDGIGTAAELPRSTNNQWHKATMQDPHFRSRPTSASGCASTT